MSLRLVEVTAIPVLRAARIYAIISVLGKLLFDIAGFIWVLGQTAWMGKLALSANIFLGFLLTLLVDMLSAAAAGFIIGILATWFYNWCARHWGGVQLELQDLGE